jgi:hypothetical protein
MGEQRLGRVMRAAMLSMGTALQAMVCWAVGLAASWRGRGRGQKWHSGFVLVELGGRRLGGLASNAVE